MYRPQSRPGHQTPFQSCLYLLSGGRTVPPPRLGRDPAIGHAVGMTQEEFIAVVRRWAFEDAAGEVAIKPVGRMPHQVLVTLWDW